LCHYGKKDQEATALPSITRLRIDGQATVALGDGSRGGLTRGDHRACEHDLGLHEQYLPCGIVDADRAQLQITCGSSAKTSDCIVDALAAWWAGVDAAEQVAMTRRHITMAHGPESSGIRTQCLHRMVQCADQMGQAIHLFYEPPSHSQYHPIERCWGILALHWHGTTWVDVETMLAWAKSMTWKGRHPVVELRGKVYQKGIALGTKAMRMIESRLARHPELPKWDMLIRPACAL
jgi:hypothetical protein